MEQEYPDMVKFFLEAAKRNLIEDGKLIQVVLLFKKKIGMREMTMMLIEEYPYENQPLAIALAAEVFGADRVLHVAEAWFATQDKNSTDTRRVRDRPEKGEGIVIAAMDKEQGLLVYDWKFTRDQAGNPVFADKPGTNQEGNMEVRLFRLLWKQRKEEVSGDNVLRH